MISALVLKPYQLHYIRILPLTGAISSHNNKQMILRIQANISAYCFIDAPSAKRD